MTLSSHPSQASIISVDDTSGFKIAEMTKKRLAIVLSPHIRSRGELVTIVPLSLTEPPTILPFHKLIDIPFELPPHWGSHSRWVKGDMVNAVGFHRLDLLCLGKDKTGKPIYQCNVLPPDLFMQVHRCVLHGLG
jgi:uncharacterized protein YifN (PemK superfamily)